mmetsp:Transcript_23807/g.35734  ORF Transcript_23807/g.35734 Transcript_23807/m.35734 type:complete len:342 (+) Transcript_23807:36-1061(+)
MVIRLECTLFLMLFVWGTQSFSLQRCPGFQQKKSLSHHAVVSKNVDRQSGNQHPATYRNMLARRIRSTTQLNMGVESVSLESLDDYEATGEFLAKAIQVSLDQEWLKQDIHAEIGARVKEIYIEQRLAGQNDVFSLCNQIREQLEISSSAMFDTKVNNGPNAKTIALLVQSRLSEKINPPENSTAVNDEQEVLRLEEGACRRLARDLEGDFGRYQWLQRALDPYEIDWVEISTVMALSLGYRAGGEGTEIETLQKQFPDSPPLFSPFTSHLYSILEEADFPSNRDELDFLDEIIGQLLGQKAYQAALLEKDQDILARVFVVKWLYHARNFFNTSPIVISKP